MELTQIRLECAQLHNRRWWNKEGLKRINQLYEENFNYLKRLCDSKDVADKALFKKHRRIEISLETLCHQIQKELRIFKYTPRKDYQFKIESIYAFLDFVEAFDLGEYNFSDIKNAPTAHHAE